MRSGLPDGGGGRGVDDLAAMEPGYERRGVDGRRLAFEDEQGIGAHRPVA